MKAIDGLGSVAIDRQDRLGSQADDGLDSSVIDRLAGKLSLG